MPTSRARKAVSPVIAVLLLILIAIAAAMILYVWVSGMVATRPTGTQQVQEAISIDAVTYEVNNSNVPKGLVNITRITAYVRNVGTLATNVTSAYAIATYPNGTEVELAMNLTVGAYLSPGSVASVTLKPGNGKGKVIPSGSIVSVKAVTKSGISASYQFIAR